MKSWFASVLLILCLTASGQGQTLPSAEPALSAKQIATIPFHLKGGGFMMVEGSVNGTQGEFMFDVGTPFPFLLNDGHVDFGPGKVIGHGAVGSGQKLTLRQYDVAAITLTKAVSFHDVKGVRTADFSFVAKGIGVTDFLGFAGRALVKSTKFLIDYDAGEIELFESGSKATTEEPEGVLEIGPKAGVPAVEFHVQDVTLAGGFDTGDLGQFLLTKAARKKLLKSGALRKEHLRGGTTYSLTGLSYGSVSLTLHGLKLKIGDANKINGYMLLKNFRTLWSYEDGTLTLLRRRSSGPSGPS